MVDAPHKQIKKKTCIIIITDMVKLSVGDYLAFMEELSSVSAL